MARSGPSNKQEYGLIVAEAGKNQQLFARSLMMILNYRYGLDIIVTESLVEAFSLVQKHRMQTHVSFVIQSKQIDNKTAISGFTNDDTIPLYVLLPNVHVKAQKELFARLDNVFFCSWKSWRGPVQACTRKLPRCWKTMASVSSSSKT